MTAATFNGIGSVTGGGIEDVVQMHSYSMLNLGFHEIVKSFLAERTICQFPVYCIPDEVMTPPKKTSAMPSTRSKVKTILSYQRCYVELLRRIATRAPANHD